MDGYTPLRAPGIPTFVIPLDAALHNARRILAEEQAANIHDSNAMIGAAVALEIGLRELVVSLTTKSSE